MLKGLKLVLLSGLIVLPVFQKASADELKIAYVNMERVIREAPAAIKAARKIDQEFEARRQELQQLSDDIKSRQAALAEKESSLSESQQLAAELSELTVLFQRKRQAYREDINIRQNEDTLALVEKANSAIVKIAKSEHLDMVLQEAIAVSERVDITDKLIKELTGD